MSANKKHQKSRRSPTITDVARESGFSISTVSHVMNGTATVSPETKQKILVTIKNLNFRPNLLASGLRDDKTKLIGLVVPDITVEFYAKFAKGVIDSLYKEGYTAVLCGTQYDFRREIDEINALVQRRVDGLIFIGGNGDDDFILNLRDRGIPIVLADRNISNSAISSVEFDNMISMKTLISNLAGKGHKRIAYLTEPILWTNLNDRYMGYRMGLIENNIQFDESLVFIDERLELNKINNAYTVMTEIIDKLKRTGAIMPDVFVTTSDLIAVGAINALKRSGINVPEDIGITGIDDILIASYLSPSLTTIRQDNEQMGIVCAELILNTINGQDAVPKRVILESQLIQRNSC